MNNHSYHLANFFGSVIISQKKKRIQSEYFYTNFILLNAKILLRLGFINGYTIKQVDRHKIIVLYLKYHQANGEPLINNVFFFSKPSRYWNIKLKELKTFVNRNSFSVYIISTPIGLMDGVSCLIKKQSGILLYKIN